MHYEDDKVGLAFFRKGSGDPDGVIATRKEAKDIVKFFHRNLGKGFDGENKVWISSTEDFVIDLSDVVVIRYHELDDEEEIEEGEDEDNLLKYGYSPED